MPWMNWAWNTPMRRLFAGFSGPRLSSRACPGTLAWKGGCTRRYACSGTVIMSGATWRTRSFPASGELLGALAAQGCYLAVATAKPLNATEMILDGPLDLRRFFNAVADSQGEDDPRITKAELIKGCCLGQGCCHGGGPGYGYPGGQGLRYPHSLAVTFGYWQPGGVGERQARPDCRNNGRTVQPPGRGKAGLPRGYFISFEGNDGAKSTQARLLTKRLTQCGYPVLLTREPGGNIAEQIRQILLSNENAEMSQAVTEAPAVCGGPCPACGACD